jgi:hypothetical protein
MYDSTIWINGWWWLGGLALIFIGCIYGTTFLIPIRGNYGPTDQALDGMGRGIVAAFAAVAVTIAIGLFFELIGHPLGVR